MALLYSKILGQGTPMIIIHGYLGMSDNWKTLGNRFAEKGYQVHLLDLRNHGRSFHSMDFSYQIMANDVKEYCEFHQLKNITLIGHSMGGKVAMLLACEEPLLIKKLFVADISPRLYTPHHQDIMKALNAVDFTQKPSRDEVENTIREYVKGEGEVQFLMKNVYRLSADQLAFRFNLQAFNQDDTQIGQALPEGYVFEGDTTFIKGENSQYITEADNELIKNHFPQSEIITIKGAGHWLHAEKPNDFFDIVINHSKL